MSRIYLDHAASTPLYPEVIDVMKNALEKYAGNPSSIHAEGRSARSQIEEARKRMARHLNASIGEIFFTSGGTESNNTAIKCAVRDLGIKRIITSPIEHHAVIHTVESCHRDFGTEIIFLQVDSKGDIDLAQLDHLLQENKKTLVSLMYVNNELGTINPMKQIATICKKYFAYLHTDAVQAVAHIPVDLQSLPIDFLSASAHKFNGPKGVGILFIRNGIKINPFIDGGGQERNIRGGTESIQNILGMALAMDLSVTKMKENENYIYGLKKYFRDALLEYHEDIYINGNEESSASNILSVSFPANEKSDLLLMNFDIAGISVSGGSACVSGAEQASHVLQAIHHPENRKTIRFSFSHFNTKSELDRVCALIREWYPVYVA